MRVAARVYCVSSACVYAFVWIVKMTFYLNVRLFVDFRSHLYSLPDDWGELVVFVHLEKNDSVLFQKYTPVSISINYLSVAYVAPSHNLSASAFRWGIQLFGSVCYVEAVCWNEWRVRVPSTPNKVWSSQITLGKQWDRHFHRQYSPHYWVSVLYAVCSF